jgi:hypothetical protein
MTNDEILDKRIDLLMLLERLRQECDEPIYILRAGMAMEEFARDLVSQAYDEAARVVEAYPTKPDALLVRRRVVRRCAESIRALKDSLAQEPVSP